ncbi:DUF427-domain-containing protein [Macrolepiota fuliginosa MF-IS2]|uniref:DUF427-domain-containing protein n=1 Tax=Macrolepiota fuliginosa MF-IS2 TaxID=1400762 RepID=A0A9P5XGY9_9AGAR|nr:DUF427-domain-containing protein [Macrolepiota fuliginosa MF-IS2]
MPTFFSIPHLEDCQKRIRAYVGGACIIDTNKAKLVWEHPYYPSYFFSEDILPYFYLELVDTTPQLAVYHVTAGNKATHALTRYYQSELAGLFTIKFSAMDSWFEEDEQIFVHPKDPYKRVDILRSSRHVRVEVAGTEVANTRMPYLLFETGLPVRYYFPKTDCRLDLLEASDHKSQCPYKGEASYYDVYLSDDRIFPNIAWWYQCTTVEAAPIKSLVAFYNEKVDIWVDGEQQTRPVTHFT